MEAMKAAGKHKKMAGVIRLIFSTNNGQFRPWLSIIACGFFMLATNAHAWGLKTHLWIAEQVLSDLRQDCTVNVGLQKRYPVPAVPTDVCLAIKKYPAEFRAGALGPDVFPDFVVGQVTTHPGIKDGWPTGKFLSHVLDAAQSDEEIAYAFGFVIHAASDVFAHTYVNNYAGDIFVLNDETRVELRHFVLEKFIESRTPLNLIISQRTIHVPARFVANHLVFDDSIQDQYKKRRLYVPHMLAMKKDLNTALKMQKRYQGLFEFVSKLTSDWDKLSYSGKRELESAKRALKDAQLVLNADITKVDIQEMAPESEEQKFNDVEEGVENKKIILQAEKDTIKKFGELQRIVKEKGKESERITGIFNQLNDFTVRFNSLSLPLGNLTNGIERATDAYMEASLNTAILIMNTNEADALSEYQVWLDCWGTAYLGIPYQAGNAYCSVVSEARRVKEDISQKLIALVKILPQPIPELARRFQELKMDLENVLKDEAWESGKELAALISRDSTLGEFLETIAKPENATAKKLNEVYASAENKKGKSLLKFPDVVSMIEKDVPTGPDGMLLPDKFHALRHSVVLSKLALLDFKTVNLMYRDNVGENSPSIFPDGDPLYPRSIGLQSIITHGVRSIDGNHQWQPYGIPYPRDNGNAEPDSADRHYGYNAQLEPPYGMRLFADPETRHKLFLKLFPTPMVGELGNQLNQDHTHNPFMVCDAVPFPLTSGNDGEPYENDKRCLSM